ncbi:MAG: glycosyltransferase family 4 protein [Patescibacteria group bacterium]
MNILILSDTTAGGEWIATQTLIKKLKKTDKSLRFFLISAAKDIDLLDESLFEEIICLSAKPGRRPFKRYRGFFNLVKSGADSINRVYERYGIDQVVATNYILACSLLATFRKNDFIYYFHGIRNNYKIFSETFDHYLIFQKLLEIFAWKVAKKLVIPSPYAKDVLIGHSLSFLKNKGVIILPNLVRDEFKNAYRDTEGKKIILYSGRLAKDKGVENLFDAYVRASMKKPGLSLTVAYPGKPEGKFEKTIRKIAKKSRNISLVNNPTDKELSNLYGKACLAVLPSPFEISSLFVREALMADLPIISTKTGDAEQILTGSFLIKDNGVNTIANKINGFFDDQVKYQKNFLKLSNLFKARYKEGEVIGNWLSLLKRI